MNVSPKIVVIVMGKGDDYRRPENDEEVNQGEYNEDAEQKRNTLAIERCSRPGLATNTPE